MNIGCVTKVALQEFQILQLCAFKKQQHVDGTGPCEGGGFLIIPVQFILRKPPMKEAVGTSQAIIAAKSLIGSQQLKEKKRQCAPQNNFGKIKFLPRKSTTVKTRKLLLAAIPLKMVCTRILIFEIQHASIRI